MTVTRLLARCLIALMATIPPLTAHGGPELEGEIALGPDSKPQPDVPRGQTFEFWLDHSRIFPGTKHRITVYVPAEYTGDKPACLYVGLDGLLFAAPTVFDNLIHKNEMPVTIAVGIAPGEVPSADPTRTPRYNRSYEFDGMNDLLARFVLLEVLPELERRQTPSGVPIRLSQDPNDRAAGGASTGGAAAFTLAWERPEAFRRVFTAIGTFVGMRGAERYNVLVRKTEPKPIRIFMQDGAQDIPPGGFADVGDWWLGNQTLERALSFAGYQVQHDWGRGGHTDQRATAIFPDVMRWLWQDWPQPLTPGTSQNSFLRDVLVTGEQWQPATAAEARQVNLTAGAGQRVTGPAGEYFTDTAAGRVGLRPTHGGQRLLDSGLKAPTGIALTPDGHWLAVAESKTHWGYSYRIEADGTLSARQRFYWFHVPDDADDSGAGGWVMDKDARLYAATRMGVQIFDHNGRVRAILPVLDKAITQIAFGGTDAAELFVLTVDHQVLHRRMKVPGFQPGSAPVVMPDWHAP